MHDVFSGANRMRKCTILHTIETGGPGGAETVLLNLATRLDHNCFRSLALLPEDGWLRQKLEQHGVTTFLAESCGWYDPRLPAEMARLILRERVDLIHSHLPDQNFFSCLVGRLTGRKTIVTYHGAVELTDARALRQAIKLRIVRHFAAAVVVVCDFVGRLLRNIGFPDRKIVRIYNGIDPARFLSSSRGRLRRELGLSPDTRLIGTVANLRQSKGYEFLVRAARHVANSVPNARFVAVGEFETENRREVADLVTEMGLEDRIFFLGFREDIPEILGDLDVFVLASVSEGFPLATLEAMAAAKPVVVTRCGGPEEIVEDGHTGFLVPPANVEALAERICEVLHSPERARTLGCNARAKVQSRFTLDHMIDEYQKLYDRVLS